MGASRFEELIAWQKARALTKEIYKVTMVGKYSKDFGLRVQIQRAAVSVMSNIAEGFERSRPKDFKKFLIYSKASCAEVRSQLYVALDIGYLDESEVDKLQQQASEVAKIVTSLRKSIKTQPDSFYE